MKIGFVGLGKMGLPIAVAMALKGHDVMGYDMQYSCMTKEPQPYQEVGPDGMGNFNSWLNSTTLRFGTFEQVLAHGDIVFVAVQTPHDPCYEGITRLPEERVDFDYSFLRTVARSVNELATSPVVLAIMSTALPGTMARDIAPLLTNPVVRLVYNPSFIAMGTTMRDFLRPEFVLVGVDDEDAAKMLKTFYATVCDSPVMLMTIESAELAKVTYNTYISLKIAFANTVMEVCDRFERADCDDVMNALKHATTRLVSPTYMDGGMGDGGGCFPAGEIVMTATGPRSIEDIRGGDLVLTHKGALRPVVRTWEREYDGELIGMKTRGCPQTWMTENHPVFVAVDGRSVVPDGRRDNRLTLSETMSLPNEILAGEIKRGHLVGWPSECVKSTVSLPEHASDEYIELAGWWLSEGSCELTTRRGRLRFDLHANETDDAERIAELLIACAVKRINDRGANARISIKSDDENCLSVRFGNMGLAKLLVADFGKGAAAKRLPPWALWGSEKTARLLLRGMIRGDGHLAISAGRISFSTISRNLAWGAFILLSRLGLDPTVRIISPRVGVDGQSHAEAWEVRVGDAANVRALCAIVGWNRDNLKPRSFQRFEVYGKRDGTTWRPVLQIDKKHYRGTVYNLWVSQDNSYVVQSGAVHNCHPRDNIAMSWLAREHKLSYDLFEAAMLCREKQAEWLIDLLLREQKRTTLPIFILGTAFKPETNLIVGSPAYLVGNLLQERGTSATYVDDTVGTPAREKDVLKTPGIFLIGCRHARYENLMFAKGSVVIDPHRYISSDNNCMVHRLGEGLKITG